MDENELTRAAHVCSAKEKRLTSTIFTADFLLDDAEIVDYHIRMAATTRPDIKSLISESGSFVRDALCISAAQFRDSVTNAALRRPGKVQFIGKNKQYGIVVVDGELKIVARRAGNIGSEPIAISKSNLELDAKANRRAVQLHPDVLNRISEMLISAQGKELDFTALPWSELISTNPENIRSIIEEIKRILFAPAKEFIAEIQVTQAQFARDLLISRRTVEDWCAGKTTMKPYIRLLTAQHYWFYEKNE